MVLVWHLNLSDILCYDWTFGRFERDIMSKSGAGYAGVCFLRCFFGISRNVYRWIQVVREIWEKYWFRSKYMFDISEWNKRRYETTMMKHNG
jgi:hypothetical protein